MAPFRAEVIEKTLSVYAPAGTVYDGLVAAISRVGRLTREDVRARRIGAQVFSGASEMYAAKLTARIDQLSSTHCNVVLSMRPQKGTFAPRTASKAMNRLLAEFARLDLPSDPLPQKRNT